MGNRNIQPYLEIIKTALQESKLLSFDYADVMDRVLDYCTYEHFSPDGDEHYIVSFPFIENEYYYNILFSFGDKCECLAPLHVRTEMKRRIHDLASIYES